MDEAISGIAGFDWDRGNRDKCQKHGVSIADIESLFTRDPVIFVDTEHSLTEERLRAIGRTHTGRYVFLVFTRRERGGKTYIRPISARYMHRKESDSYEEENPDLSE